MPKATQPKEVAVLSSSKHGLMYLTANDWMLIADKAVRKQFKAGESLIQQGKRTHGVYVLLNGTASLQVPSQENSPEIAPGGICGEISFLDELPATVGVVAKEPVEAYYLDRPTLQTLFELFPHMGSRFYHSLACRVAGRLRDLIVQTWVPKNE